MDLLSLKRRLLGHSLRWNDRGTDSTGTGSGNTGGSLSGGNGWGGGSRSSAQAIGSNGSVEANAIAEAKTRESNLAAAADAKAKQEAAAKAAADARAAADAKAKQEAAAKAAADNTARVRELAGLDTPAAAPAPSQTFNLAAAADAKPGEDMQARAGAMIGLNLSGLAKQSMETGVSLSTLMGGVEPTRAQLERLSETGYGSMYGVNPNNLEGQTVDNMIAASRTGSVLGNVGQFALNTAVNMVPGAAFVKAGIKGIAAYNAGASAADIAKNAGWDLAGGWAAGQINGEVAKAIGKDARAVVGDYNRVASLASLAGVNLPSANVGSRVVGAAREAFGPAAATGSGTRSNVMMPDGTPAERFGGNSSADARPAPAAAPAVVRDAPAQAGSDYTTDMRFGLNGAAAGRAIREGAMRRQHKGF